MNQPTSKNGKNGKQRKPRPPMNPQWLTAIRERVIATDLGTLHSALSAAVKDRADLLQEVMRSQAREAAALSIVWAMARTRNDGVCPYCQRAVERHTATCLVTQARALLAGETTGESEASDAAV